MSIHIKDWGMIPTPARKTAMSQHGLNDRAEANNVLARSIHDGIVGLGCFLESQEKIQRLGEEAELYEHLDEIAQESKEELAAKGEVGDWASAWTRAHAPRVEALLKDYPAQHRASNLALAQRHSQRASAQAQSERERGMLQSAKNQWAVRMKKATEAGRLEEQNALFEEGAGVFFSESEREPSKEHLLSANKKHQWLQGLSADPLSTLAQLNQAKVEDLPAEKKHQQELNSQLLGVRRGVKAQLTQSLLHSILDDSPFDEDAIRNSAKAAVITEAAAETTLNEKPFSSPMELCQWTRRVDECDYNDADCLIDLQLALATSPLSRADKRKLVSRAEGVMKVPFDKRCMVSRQSWAYYQQGFLGALQDPFTLQRLNRLQSEGMSALQLDPQKGFDSWAKQAVQDMDTWVCFND